MLQVEAELIIQSGHLLHLLRHLLSYHREEDVEDEDELFDEDELLDDEEDEIFDSDLAMDNIENDEDK